MADFRTIIASDKYRQKCSDSIADKVLKALLNEESIAPITAKDVQQKGTELEIEEINESCREYIAEFINENRGAPRTEDPIVLDGEQVSVKIFEGDDSLLLSIHRCDPFSKKNSIQISIQILIQKRYGFGIDFKLLEEFDSNRDLQLTPDGKFIFSLFDNSLEIIAQIKALKTFLEDVNQILDQFSKPRVQLMAGEELHVYGRYKIIAALYAAFRFYSESGNPPIAAIKIIDPDSKAFRIKNDILIVGGEIQTVETVCDILEAELRIARHNAICGERSIYQKIEYENLPEDILTPIKNQDRSDIKLIADALSIDIPDDYQNNDVIWKKFIEEAYEFYEDDGETIACLKIPELKENEEQWKEIINKPKNNIITQINSSQRQTSIIHHFIFDPENKHGGQNDDYPTVEKYEKFRLPYGVQSRIKFIFGKIGNNIDPAKPPYKTGMEQTVYNMLGEEETPTLFASVSLYVNVCSAGGLIKVTRYFKSGKLVPYKIEYLYKRTNDSDRPRRDVLQIDKADPEKFSITRYYCTENHVKKVEVYEYVSEINLPPALSEILYDGTAISDWVNNGHKYIAFPKVDIFVRIEVVLNDDGEIIKSHIYDLKKDRTESLPKDS